MDTFKNKAAFIMFVVILLIFIVGGYFGMNYFINMEDSENDIEQNIVESVDYRIDKTKDYIYLTDTDIIVSGMNITFAKININLSSAKDLEERINNEVNSFSSTVVKSDTVEIPEETVTFPNPEGVYSVSYKDYEIIEFDSYITLIDKNFDYNIINYSTATGLEVNIFDKNTGNLVNESEILNLKGNTLENVKEAVKSKLNTLNIDGAGINIDETINNFDYGVYLNKIGDLEVIYLVKSTNQNYYDTLVIN